MASTPTPKNKAASFKLSGTTSLIEDDSRVFDGIDGNNNISVSGSISVKDEDAGQNFLRFGASDLKAGFVQIPATGGWGDGKLVITYASNGTYSYTYSVNEESASFQSLGIGNKHTETFTLLSSDGSSFKVSFDVVGTSDDLTEDASLKRVTLGSVKKDSDEDHYRSSIDVTSSTKDYLTSTGFYNASKSDSIKEAHYKDGTYYVTKDGSTTTKASDAYWGSLKIDEAGHYTFMLDNSLSQVQELNIGQTQKITFKIPSKEGVSPALTFFIHGSDDAPIIGGTSSSEAAVTFNENDSGVTVEANPLLFIDDIDSANMSSAKAVITNAKLGDALIIKSGFTLPDGVKVEGKLDGSSYVLTITGEASKESYALILKNIQFTSDSENPNTEQRNVEFTAYDDQKVASNTVLHYVNVVAVNDNPTTSEVTLTAIAEDSGKHTITAAQLLANANDVEGDNLTVSELEIASGNGSLVSKGNGVWEYTPDDNDDTSVSFSYTITDDGETNGTADHKTASGTATLDITPVDEPVTNHAPTAINLDNNSIKENNAAGFKVSTLSASDPDVGDSFTYSLVDNYGDNNLFTITGTSLNISPITNYEDKSSYDIKLHVVDAGGLGIDSIKTIDVINQNEAPTSIKVYSTSGSGNTIINKAWIEYLMKDVSAPHITGVSKGTGGTTTSISGDNVLLKNDTSTTVSKIIFDNSTEISVTYQSGAN